MFQKSPLPVWSVYAFGYMLPVVEAIIGACVLLGFQTRRPLIAGSVLMLILTFGSTLRQDWPTVGIQPTYSVVYSLLLAAVPFNSFCVDQLTGQKAGS
jgi:thiosulfate dehydrogenase [quinone] large subunit